MSQLVFRLRFLVAAHRTSSAERKKKNQVTFKLTSGNNLYYEERRLENLLNYKQSTWMGTGLPSSGRYWRLVPQSRSETAMEFFFFIQSISGYLESQGEKEENVDRHQVKKTFGKLDWCLELINRCHFLRGKQKAEKAKFSRQFRAAAFMPHNKLLIDFRCRSRRQSSIVNPWTRKGNKQGTASERVCCSRTGGKKKRGNVSFCFLTVAFLLSFWH